MSNDVTQVQQGEPVHAGLNVRALHGALDAERKARRISWRQVAREADISPSTLSRMGNGYKPDVDAFAKLVRWLGVAADMFLIGSDPAERSPDLVAELAPLLRARHDLSDRDVAYLEDVIGAAVRRFNAEREEA